MQFLKKAASIGLAMTFAFTLIPVNAEGAGTRDEAAEQTTFLTTLNNDGYAEVGAYKVEKIQDGIYHMDESTKALPGGANDADGNMNNPSSIYFVQTENDLLIIDGGNQPADGSSKEVDARIIVDALAGTRTVSFALTHGHPDHVGLLKNLNVFKNHPLAALYMNNNDATMAGLDASYTAITHDISGGDTFEVGGLTYNVLDINAHTAGSVVFINYANNVLFTGDSIGSGFIWLFWQDGTNPIGTLSTGISALQTVVKNMTSPKFLCGHRWQQFWESNAERPGEMSIQYLNDMAACITGLTNGTTIQKEYTARSNDDDVELSTVGGKAKIDTTKALIQEYITAYNSYTNADVNIFNESATLSINTENNTSAAKFMIYADGAGTKAEDQKLIDDMGISDIIKNSASEAMVIHPLGTDYTDADVAIFKDLLANKLGPTTNLKVIGIGKGATFVNKYVSQYDWGIAGIMTYGGEAGSTPKYAVPTYVSNSGTGVADAYIEANSATNTSTEGTLTTNVNPDSRFEIVVENSAQEDVNAAFKNAWDTVLSKFGRIGNIARDDGAIGTWYLKTNDIEREFMFFDSVDAITNINRTVVTEDLNGNGVDSLWYEYIPEQSKNADDGTVPVVFLMHGNTNDPRTQYDTSGWANIASEEGVILVCPEWQGHNYQGYAYDAMTSDTNFTADSDFTKMVKEVIAKYPQIDADRVYISGLSAGCRNTTNNGLVNTSLFAAGAGQSGPFKNTDAQAAQLQDGVDANKDSYDFPIIYFAGDKDEYLQDWDDITNVSGGLQIAQLYEELNDMDVTQLSDLSSEYSQLYGIPFTTFGYVENEGLCKILGGTIENSKGVEISFNRIFDWGHWNYAADAKLMWNFMKKYARDSVTGETIRLDKTPYSYDVTSGDNALLTKGAEADLEFTIDRTFADFSNKVTVDGNELTSDQYVIDADTNTITLTKEYLKTLDAGEHQMIASFKYGEASAKFTITAAALTDDNDSTVSANTGDNTQTGLYLGLLLLALIGIGGVIVFKKKHA